MTQNALRLVSDRGAVLVHTAFALLALVAFTTFVADYGTLWLARAQAQNSADAAALAGAIALSYDDPNDFTTSGPAKQTAYYISQQNLVYGEAPRVDMSIGDIEILGPPDRPQRCPDGSNDYCVQVDVYRHSLRDNPLPTFFGPLVGLTRQNIRARAIAQVQSGNATDCLKPWSIVDRWDEASPLQYPGFDPEFMPDSTYDTHGTGLPQIPQEDDLYVPPSATAPGTGYDVTTDLGRQIAIKTSSGPNAVTPGWFRAIRIPRSDGVWSGGSFYKENIENCGGLPAAFAAPGGPPCPTSIDGATAAYWATQGCYRVETGNMVGPTGQGVTTIIARDPGAYWDSMSGTVSGSAHALSPRIVPVGVMDIDNYLSQDPTGSLGVVRLVNIFGFFIEGMGNVALDGTITCCSPGGQDVIGRLMTLPGLYVTSGSGIDPDASFLKTIVLVR
jgi:hypothetical protein